MRGPAPPPAPRPSALPTYGSRFGDGTGALRAATSHTYANAGTYSVRLIVTDPLGLADTVTTTASVASWTSALQTAIALAEGLVASGAMDQGNGRALTAMLQGAVKGVATDRTSVPVLVSHIADQLQTFIRIGHATEADAAPLAALLDRIRSTIGG